MQRDYIGHGKLLTIRHKTNSRKKKHPFFSVSNTIIVLATTMSIIFIGGLYLIMHNKSNEAVFLLNYNKNTSNGLPPKPEERWFYIKELENHQYKVPYTEPNNGDGREVNTPAQLTDEQHQLLEQMQADMHHAPIHLNKVP